MEWKRVLGYRAMTPQRRFEIAQALVRSGRLTVEGAVQEQRPGLSPLEVELELWHRIYGRQWLTRERELNREGRRWMEDWEVVTQIVRVLETNEIPYTIVGGYSAIYWGRPRFTQDADLLVALQLGQIDTLVNALGAQFVISRAAIEEAVRQRSEFNLIHQAEVFKVDLWVTGNTAYEQEVLRRRRRGAFGHAEAYYRSPEDTILSKLRWCNLANFSERQFEDALGVYEIQEPTLDQAYLDRWAHWLGIEELVARVRAEASRPPEESK
jgi:hypothetical protein